MDRETDLYFRRLTWIASKYYHQTAIGTNTALDPFANIPFGVPSSKNSSQTLRALQSFSNLLTRSAKVVVVASEGSRLSVMEEPAKEEQCLTGSIEETGETPRASAAMIKANAKGHGEGKFVISRNPRWSMGAVEDGADFSWFGNVGIRSMDVSPNSTFRPPISPNRPFAEHVETLLDLVQAKGTSDEDYTPTLHGQIYILRTCFLKIAARASEHCPAMQPREKAAGGKQKGAASVSTTGTITGDGHGLKETSGASVQASVTGSTKQQKAKGFDYGARLIPARSEASENVLKSISNLFERANRWKDTQTNSVSKLLDIAVKLDGSIANRDLDIKITSICSEALEYSALKFKTRQPEDITTFCQVHEAFGALLLCFFSGIRTLAMISTTDTQEDLWEDFTSHDTIQLQKSKFEVWSSLCAVATSGSLLNELVRTPEVDPVYERYLEILLGSAEHAEGCLKWLQTTTEHYTSLADLRTTNIQNRLARCRVSLIDVRFSKDHRDNSIMDLDEFFEKVPALPSDLTRNDRVRLANEVKASQGEHAELIHFNGTMHAETILLILILMVRREKYKNLVPSHIVNIIKSINPTILAVSKRCCPVCSMVMQIVEARLEITISHSGSHPTYSACCLPPWTPLDLAQEIVQTVESAVVPGMLVPRALELRRTLRTTRGSGTPEPLDRAAVAAPMKPKARPSRIASIRKAEEGE